MSDPPSLAQPGRRIARARVTVELEAVGFDRLEAEQAVMRAAQAAQGSPETHRATVSELDVDLIDDPGQVDHGSLRALAEKMLAQAPVRCEELMICTLRVRGPSAMPSVARAVLDTAGAQALLMDCVLGGGSAQSNPAAFQAVLDEQFGGPCRMLIRDWFADSRRTETVEVCWSEPRLADPEGFVWRAVDEDPFAARALALLIADGQLWREA